MYLRDLKQLPCENSPYTCENGTKAFEKKRLTGHYQFKHHLFG
jgi:hypothetical protein